MNTNAFEYLAAVYAAWNELNGGDDMDGVRRAADQLRAIAPDHRLLPLLDAKCRSLTVRSLLRGACATLDSPIVTRPASRQPKGTAEEQKSDAKATRRGGRRSCKPQE